MERPVFADISLEYKDEWNRRIISDNVGACGMPGSSHSLSD